MRRWRGCSLIFKAKAKAEAKEKGREQRAESRERIEFMA